MGMLGKVRWCLLGCLIFILAFVTSSIFMPGGLSSAVKWLADTSFSCKLRTFVEQERIGGEELVEMLVDSIRVSEVTYQPAVVLKEKSGELYLPIMIGLIEANDILVMLEGVPQPRPLTPDLLYRVVGRTGASVDSVVIHDIRGGIFYANVILYANWAQTKIDARPSDAIALALRLGAPIYVTKTVLEKAAILPESEKQ